MNSFRSLSNDLPADKIRAEANGAKFRVLVVQNELVEEVYFLRENNFLEKVDWNLGFCGRVALWLRGREWPPTLIYQVAIANNAVMIKWSDYSRGFGELDVMTATRKVNGDKWKVAWKVG
ncbi:hypothetical protein [Parachitinimonas caeni]|uniref:Uncharacterized protein n=1 Tax=Parachitinimonas caeni TaxID=3031301 RepID=A0ABT7E408_9NEIS|nr:hypothetical protein [Parachitinimonas caeni]MDK2127056.1 hypothetical protein [Parachitinimonas caeni]